MMGANPGRGRIALVLLLFFLLALAGGVISMMMGSVEIPLQEILGALAGAGGTHAQILWNIRLPRTLVAALVGIDLALAGTILQAIMKNPLADPHIIGISSGAGLMGILVLLLFPEHSELVTPAAFVGAMGAAVLIYLLAWKNGIQPIRIILAGVAVSAFLGAGISALMILYSDRVHNALMWMVGGLSARSWPHVAMLWPYTLVGFALAVLAASTPARAELSEINVAQQYGISYLPLCQLATDLGYLIIVAASLFFAIYVGRGVGGE